MAQVIAGETLTLTLNGGVVEVKIEDASKSEAVLAKVMRSEVAGYVPGQVCTFERSQLP